MAPNSVISFEFKAPGANPPLIIGYVLRGSEMSVPLKTGDRWSYEADA